MKKTLLIIAFAAAMTACSTPQSQPLTVSGTVIDATMNNVMIYTATGDSINISTMDVMGLPGLLLADSVQITYKDTLDYKVARSIVILKNSPYGLIQGSWIQPSVLNKEKYDGFTLNQDGTVAMIDMHTLVFKTWTMPTLDSLVFTGQSIGNRETIDFTDGYKMERLDADSLILSSNGYVVFRLGHPKQ